KNQYTKHRICLDKQKHELAQRKQTHHELVTEQKRLERKNVEHARFGLLPPTPQETTALAEKLNLFQTAGDWPSPATATSVADKASEPARTSATAASGSTPSQTDEHN